jgi:hypothetical protein
MSKAVLSSLFSVSVGSNATPTPLFFLKSLESWVLGNKQQPRESELYSAAILREQNE